MFTRENYIEWLKLTYTDEERYYGWELMWRPEAVPNQENLYNKADRLKELNKIMIEEFPFLLPRNRFTDKPMDNYDYSYNEWQAIPFGWQVAFGWKLLHELNILVQSLDKPENFRISQIKEKWGELRVYSNGDHAIWQLVDDYSDLSARTCIICGKPAKYITRYPGWVSPFCEEHIGDRITDADLIGDNYVYNK